MNTQTRSKTASMCRLQDQHSIPRSTNSCLLSCYKNQSNQSVASQLGRLIEIHRIVSYLHRFTKPTGLYPSCQWDERTIRKMILEGKISPRFEGFEVKHKVGIIIICTRNRPPDHHSCCVALSLLCPNNRGRWSAQFASCDMLPSIERGVARKPSAQR